MDIFDIYRAAADPEKAKQMSAYMRDQFPFLGLQTPKRKKLSLEFLKETPKSAPDWAFVFKCWEQPEREFQYLAVNYLAKIAPVLTADDIANLREIAVNKPWWDTIDGLDVITGDIALRFPKVNDTLLAWSADRDFWLRRIAIDHQRGRKERTDAGLLSRIIVNNLGQTEFFINKAIGWSLREYSKTNPGWVRGFVAGHSAEMSPLSVREASKYI
ncbi:MAG: DNA alkylation repair protein [Acidaminococcales bacterium]|nr:DNA alkylation repair protein [Acidaminococcales bacterium]